MADSVNVTHDVVLGGVGYMLARSQKQNFVKETSKASGSSASGLAHPGAVYRLHWSDWRGYGRPFLHQKDSEGGRFGGQVADMDGLRPVLGGAALMLCPGTNNATIGATSATHFASLIYNGVAYVTKENRIYSIGTTSNKFNSTLAAVGGALLGNVVSCGYDASGIGWACYGANAAKIDDGVTLLGKQASHIAAYHGLTFRSVASAASLEWYVNGVIQGYSFGSNITALCVHEGALWIGTEAGLWRLEGTLEESDPAVAPGVYDKFVYNTFKVVGSQPDHLASYPECGNWRQLHSFAGALWGCKNGRFYKIVTSSAFKFDAQEQPLPYGWVWSIASGAGLLFVAKESPGRGRTVWGYDPAMDSWFMVDIADAGPGHTELLCPGSIARDAALMSFHNGTDKVSWWSFDSSNQSGVNQTNYDNGWPFTEGILTLPFLPADELLRLAGIPKTATQLQLTRAGIDWQRITPVEGFFDWPAEIYQGVTNMARLDISVDGFNWITLLNDEGVDEYFPLANNISKGRTDWKVTAGYDVVKPGGQYSNEANWPQSFYGWQLRYILVGPVVAPIRSAWVEFKVGESLVSSPPAAASGTAVKWRLALDLGKGNSTTGLDGQLYDYPASTLWDYFLNGTTLTFNAPEENAAVKITNIEEIQTYTGTPPVENPSTLMWVELTQVTGWVQVAGDSFNRANISPVTAPEFGPAYENTATSSVGYAPLSIVSDQLKWVTGTLGGSTFGSTALDVGSGNQKLEAKIGTMAGRMVFYVRGFIDSTDGDIYGYYAEINLATDAKMRLYYYHTGPAYTYTLVGISAGNFASGDLVEVEALEGSVVVKQNGVAVISTTGALYQNETLAGVSLINTAAATIDYWKFYKWS